MRFIADENVPQPSVLVLRAAGYDVVSVSEEAPSMEDPSIIEWAIATGRIVITFDRDYGDLVFRDRLAAPPGIILLRYQPDAPGDIGSRILALIEHEMLRFEGMMTVVRRQRHRQRALSDEGRET